MSGFLRCVFFAFAATFALFIAPLSPCRAQSKETAPPPGVPMSLWVPDRFERAAKNISSAPSYLAATIVNDTTDHFQKVCIEGAALFEAVRVENNLGHGWGGSRENRDKALRLILENPTRTYHFKNEEAWRMVQPRATPEYLALAEQELRGQTVEELAHRFDYQTTHGIITVGDLQPGNLFAYCAALACVLTERGLYVGRGDFGNSLYVITPKMLADEAKEQQARDAAWQKHKDAGKQLGLRLSGYNKLQKAFRLTDVDLVETWQGFCLISDVEARRAGTINSIYWLNPANKKTNMVRYEWNQFLPIAGHIERLARQHPWLKTWKQSGPNRRIEARMFGKNIHSESDEDVRNDVVPAWKDAGLRGPPYCELILH